MTRIVGGSVGGRRLRTPDGERTRPTSERVREALFSALDARLGTDGWARTTVLDLYAGSGALGLEAVSRGARSVTLVESDRRTAQVAARNAQDLGLSGVTVRAAKVETFLRDDGERTRVGPVDLVLADPPYPLGEADLAAVLALLAEGWLAPEADVVVERSRRSPEPTWPAGLEPRRSRRYGETVLHTGRWDALWYGPTTERPPVG